MKNVEIEDLKKFKRPINHGAGVYILFNKNKIIYIGHSKNIIKRVTSHASDPYSRASGYFKQPSELMVWDSYTFIKIEDKKERMFVETALLEKYKPKYNKTFCSRKNN